MKFASLLAPFALLGLAISAPAAVTALGIAGETNAFITGNMTANGGQSQGSIIVGGDFKGSNYDVRGTSGSSTPSSVLPANTALYVGGSNQTSNFTRTNNGNAIIAGTKGTLYQNGGGTYTKASYDLAPTVDNLTKLSSDLTTFASVTLDTSAQNNIVVNTALNTANGNLKVYTVDGSLLSGNKTIKFEGTGNETVVVNVTGSTLNWGLSLSGGIDSSKILWNFTGTAANIGSRAFDGTLLALNANVTQNESFTGNLIAKNLTVNNSATLKVKNFTGNIPLVSAPEPAGVMTMGGFLALALFSRRRQAARL
ncbi:MAG: choice-of-anchor A family protein [Verrucomicrobiaceae bacterium]|nr:MAG: choice-of-anchor A family protein [Verrucomicrobiaceae bacterium]